MYFFSSISQILTLCFSFCFVQNTFWFTFLYPLWSVVYLKVCYLVFSISQFSKGLSVIDFKFNFIVVENIMWLESFKLIETYLWLSIWSILISIPCATEYVFCLCWVEWYRWGNQWIYSSVFPFLSLFLLIFLSYTVRMCNIYGMSCYPNESLFH